MGLFDFFHPSSAIDTPAEQIIGVKNKITAHNFRKLFHDVMTSHVILDKHNYVLKNLDSEWWHWSLVGFETDLPQDFVIE